MSPFARAALNNDEGRAVLERAESMGVDVGAVYGTRARRWAVSVRVKGAADPAVSLTGYGSLAAVLAGALDDFETARLAA